MRLHSLHHVPFEDAANIAVYAKEKSFNLSETNLYKGESFPSVSEIDLFLVMGGPMNIYEEDKYPWLLEEKRYLLSVLKAGKPVIGVCLGAQLIADVLGAKVKKNTYKEIGWFDVRLTEEGKRSPFFKNEPSSFEAFHWHGDTFEIPKGASRLCENDACSSQAFSYGENVLALQFHLDYSYESVSDMLANCPDELEEESPYIQRKEDILSKERTNKLFERLKSVFDAFYSSVYK